MISSMESGLVVEYIDRDYDYICCLNMGKRLSCKQERHRQLSQHGGRDSKEHDAHENIS